MSWQDRALLLCRRLGPGAKFAAKLVLGAILPGSPAVVELVGEALDCAHETAKEHWEISRDRPIAGSPTDLARLDEVLGILTGELSALLAQVAGLRELPDAARQVLNTALATDDRVQSALAKLDNLARRFDRLEEQNRLLLAQQGFAADVLAELLPLVRRLVGVADFVEEWKAEGLSPSALRARLEAVQQFQVAFVHGQFHEAGRQLQPLQQIAPDSAVVGVAVAAIHAANHDLRSAEASLTHAAGRRPGDHELAYLSRRLTQASRLDTRAAIDTPRHASHPGVGEVLGGWSLEALLGAGGWGQVFRARKGERVGALKVMHPELAVDSTFDERFRREIMTLIRLDQHPSLVRIQDFGCDLDRRCWYFVMDLLDGWSLERYLRERGPLTVKQARNVFARLADGLALAHARGVVHRDIKPANIILRRDGIPVLVDFGVAVHLGATELTRAGAATGCTLAFASPEQLRGRPADARSDVYSLAGTMYYALVYNRPEIREPEHFEPEHVAEEVSALLARALHHRAERRAADAGAFREAIVAIQTRPRLVEVKLPGIWWRRERTAPETAPWEVVGNVPATVQVDQRAVYRLELAEGTTDDDLKGLKALQQELEALQLDSALHELSFRGCEQVTDAGLAHLQPLSTLRALDLSLCSGLTDVGLAYLRSLSALQALDLSCDRVTAAGLKHLRSLSSLQLLVMEECYGVTDAGLQHLCSLTALRTLRLNGCEELTDAGLKHLASLSALQELDLQGCEELTDAGLKHLASLSSLQSLWLAGGERVTDAGLAHLCLLTSLEWLWLAGCEQVTDVGLRQLCSLSSLQALCLQGCSQVTDAGLAHLSSLPTLQSLWLTRCVQVTDAGLAHLRGLTSLQELNLEGCEQVTDAGLAHLRSLSALERLNLDECKQLTGAGLVQLCSLSALQSLTLSGCDRVTQAGLQSIRQALPRCDISR
jgi:hypothetical protein